VNIPGITDGALDVAHSLESKDDRSG
jgi:hypothetical protein